MTNAPATVADFDQHRPIRPGRKPDNKTGQNIMFATHTSIVYEVAVQRQEELVRRVEQARLIEQAVAGRQSGAVQAARRFAGTLIVRTGQRVQGQESRPVAGAPTPGILRMAR